MLKCSCCGSKKLETRRLSDGAQFGGIRLDINEFKFKKVDKARVCTDCGNVMPFVDPKVFTEEYSIRKGDNCIFHINME